MDQDSKNINQAAVLQMCCSVPAPFQDWHWAVQFPPKTVKAMTEAVISVRRAISSGGTKEFLVKSWRQICTCVCVYKCVWYINISILKMCVCIESFREGSAQLKWVRQLHELWQALILFLKNWSLTLEKYK